MRSTGIIRRIDDLGRILIPKEIRRSMELHDGDPLEMYIGDDNTLCMKPYRPIGAIAEDKDILTFIDGLCESFGVDIVIADKKGFVLFSTFKGLREHRLLGAAVEYCSADCSEDKVENLKSCTYSYDGPIKGLCRIYANDKIQSYCEGAVFVCGAVESAPQIAKTIASVMVKKFELYN